MAKQEKITIDKARYEELKRLAGEDKSSGSPTVDWYNAKMADYDRRAKESVLSATDIARLEQERENERQIGQTRARATESLRPGRTAPPTGAPPPRPEPLPDWAPTQTPNELTYPTYEPLRAKLPPAPTSTADWYAEMRKVPSKSPTADWYARRLRQKARLGK